MHKTRLDPKDLPPVEAAMLRRILAYVALQWRRALLVLACMAGAAALNLCLPWFILRIVDDAIPTGNLTLLWVYCGAMVAGPAAAGLLEVVQKFTAERMGQQVMLDLRVALYRQLHAMPFAFFAKQQPGEAVSHVLNDVQGVGGVVSGTIVEVAQNVIVLVTTGVFVFMLDWRLALVAIALLPLFIVPTRRVGRTRKRLKRAVQARVAELTGILTETLSVSGALLVKVFGGHDRELDRFRAKAEEIKALSLEQSLVGRWFQLLLGLFEAVGPAIVFAAGGYLVIQGHVALGTVIAFVTVLKRLYGPARQLAGVHVDLVTGYAYFERVFSVLDRMPSIRDAEDAVTLTRAWGHIELTNVSFSYDGTDRTLADIDLEIPSGATVAIVGPSGAGKSTIASLVMRLYDVGSGSVTIDGIDVRSMTSRSLRDSLAVVTQETFLFHASVLENLRYAKPSASLAEVANAARRAQIHDVIDALPEGYDTIVGERGYRFSAGERQRLAIARAILKNPRILILDEATSSLDSESERRVQAALVPLCKGRTTLVIAHRLSTIRDADLIVVLDRGRIVERGTHDELMANAGLYSWLWRVQAGRRVGKVRSLVTRAAAAAGAAILLAVAAPAQAQVKTSLISLDLHAKTQMDLRDFAQEPGAAPAGVFDLRRARVGVEGKVMKRFQYQVERELHDRTQPWRDVYVDARVLRALELRGGQFKVPFSLDELTGAMDLDFNSRSLAGTYLAPGRDTGVMAHGRLAKSLVRYQTGIFSNRTVAGRVVFKTKALAAGVAFTDGKLPSGLNSIRGKTVAGDPFFDHLYVAGRRRRIGLELQWQHAAFRLQGEYMRARDERRGQGLNDDDLPSAIAHGWYASGTRPVLKRRIGTIELAGRVEQLRASSAGGVRTRYTSPRSEWFAPRTDTVGTIGVNWLVNDYIKLQANLVREHRTVDARAIAADGPWSRTLRVQFGF